MKSSVLILLCIVALQLEAQENTPPPEPENVVSTEVVEKEVYKYYKIPTSEVYQAVVAADVERLEELKKGHISYYDYNADGETVLTLAVKLGHLDVVKSLEQQAVINMKNKEGETPLTLAIKSQNREMIKVILQRAKAALRNDADETPIYLALEMQDINLIASLIHRGADVNIRSQGNTPLSKAVELNNIPIASLLIKNGADPSKPNKNGEIPLYIALSKEFKVMAGMLLGKSEQPMKDVNWKNKLGEPMIIIATRSKNLSMVNQLIAFGADPDATDYMENTATIVAAAAGNREILIALITTEAELNLQNNKGETALIAAMLNNQKESMTLLVQAGADPGYMDYSGNSAQRLYDPIPSVKEKSEVVPGRVGS